MEAIRSSKTSVSTISTRRQIPEDYFLLCIFILKDLRIRLLLFSEKQYIFEKKKNSPYIPANTT
jgi:hypothetical protein